MTAVELSRSSAIDWRRVGVWGRGFWLFALYLVSIVAVTAALTDYQLQHNIRTFDAGGESLAVWRILQLRDTWNQAQSEKVAAETSFKEALDTVEQRRRGARENDEAYWLLWYTWVDAQKELERLLSAARATTAAVMFAASVNGDPRPQAAPPEGSAEEVETRLAGQRSAMADASGQATAQLVSNETEASESEPSSSGSEDPFITLTASYVALEPSKKTEEIEVAYKAFVEANREENAAENASLAADRALENAIKNLEERRERVVGAIDAVSKVLTVYEDQRVRSAAGDFLSQLNYLTSIPGGQFFEFGAMANDMLTLILVLAMGALGGTIHLTRIYLAGELRGFSYYLFRPLLGAITALAVYVIARAGVFVLSDPTASGVRSPLSPFFISFLAIVSGLLAERAIVGIESVGSRWFSSADEEQRWAANVAKEITDQSKDISEIEPLLNADPARTASWLEQREPVPLPAQTTIAAWLGKPIRDLFSDLPPPQRAVENTSPASADSAFAKRLS